MICIAGLCAQWYWWLVIVIAVIAFYATGTAPTLGAGICAILAIYFMIVANWPMAILFWILVIILSPEIWPVVIGFAIIALIIVFFWKIIAFIGIILGFILFLFIG